MEQREPLSRPRQVGHLLGIALSVLNLGGVFLPSGTDDDGNAVGPPVPVLVFGVLVSLVVIGLLVWSWRTDQRGPRRIAAVLLVLNALTAVPAFGQTAVADWVKALAGIGILATIVVVVLLFYPDRRLWTARSS